ncbi:MAG: hypothetical protein IPO93_05730 [Actinobacteria bacterium]|nr:hypothetical protein [Actinomycetota bacterium]
MTPEEARAAATLAGRAVAGVANTVETTHEALADWTLRTLGRDRPLGPWRMIHKGTYAAIRTAAPLVGTAAGHAASRLIDPAAPSVATTPRGSIIQGALNGAVGSDLHSASSALAVRMSLRTGNRDVACERGDLSAAYPDASSQLVVFVHGLCHDENAWTPRPDPDSGAPRPSFAERLADDTSATALLLRYNTGRHISENGRDLSHLLHDLFREWPVPVTSLVLVGHSMGGLVIRSACAQARPAGSPWLGVTRLVATIGTPHTGAPLERFAAATERRLASTDLTRGLARICHARSAGIKDLRRGYIHVVEWADCDQDTCAHDHRRHEPPLETAEHLVVASTVTRDPRHPLGRAVGDILVRTDSAHGLAPDGRHVGFPSQSEHTVGGVTHLGLLHDPRVYEHLRARIADA